MKRILILGAGKRSFIGRNLREGLEERQQYRVFAPPREELNLLEIESLKKYVYSHKIDIIVNAAVHVPMFHGEEKEFFYDMQMFWNVQSIGREVDKVIYFGSGAEYDKRFHIRNVKEENIGDSIPTSEYGLAKYTMNHIARDSDNIYNLRLFGVFGKYELWQIKFLSNLCCKAVYGLPLTIRQDCDFDFLYIQDLVEVVIWFVENTPSFRDYNVCHGRGYNLMNLANMVKEVSGKKLEIYLLNEERNLDYTASNERLRKQIDGLSITPMYDAIEALYCYYLKNMNLIDLGILGKSR